MTDAAPLTVKVIAERIAECQHTLDKMIRKAARFGATGIEYTVGAPFDEKRAYERWDGSIGEYVQQIYPVTITGVAPTVGDFEFIAKLEHTPGGVIIDMVPGAAGLDARFRTDAQVCEHCKTRRIRKHTFICRERATGRQVQVGHNCIHDFLGVNLAQVLQRFTFWRGVGGESDEWGGGGWRPEFRQVEELLTLGHVLVRLFGYASLATAEATGCNSTSYYVAQMFRTEQGLSDYELKELRELRQRVREAKTDNDLVLAQETRAWAISQSVDSEYMHNLRVLCAGDTIPTKRQGYVVSAISAHARAIERQLQLTKQREARKDSVHVGTVGERLRGLTMVFESARVIGGEQFSSCLWKFRDEAGNAFSWFATRGTNMKAGERFTLTGTVKAHRLYKEVKETQLTRCKVEPMKAGVPA
jgi:hypothetical protein